MHQRLDLFNDLSLIVYVIEKKTTSLRVICCPIRSLNARIIVNCLKSRYAFSATSRAGVFWAVRPTLHIGASQSLRSNADFELHHFCGSPLSVHFL